jgi:hypothetical protein
VKKWQKNEQKWGKNEQKRAKTSKKNEQKKRDFVVPFFPKTTLFFARFQKKVSKKRHLKKGT